MSERSDLLAFRRRLIDHELDFSNAEDIRLVGVFRKFFAACIGDTVEEDRPATLTVTVDGPSGSGVTRLASAIRSEGAMWDALPKFNVVDMSERRDGRNG